MKSYTVQAGDTLFGLAEREYGDGTLYPVIAAQNQLANPNVISVGQQLLVPYVTYRFHATGPDSTAARTAITQRFYGTSDTQMQLIWEVVSGVAQREIKQGTWLLIPDLANSGHHTVVAGETLIVLADRWYGDVHLAEVIALANQLPFGTDPAPGTVLIVPGLNRRHQIAGDTLASLCREEYGDVDVDLHVKVVAAANHIADPGSVFSNQVVYFPS